MSDSMKDGTAEVFHFPARTAIGAVARHAARQPASGSATDAYFARELDAALGFASTACMHLVDAGCNHEREQALSAAKEAALALAFHAISLDGMRTEDRALYQLLAARENGRV